MFAAQDEDRAAPIEARRGEDRAALKAAIIGEYAAFHARNYNDWASHWMKDQAACHWSWHLDKGLDLFSGWDRLSAFWRDFYVLFPKPQPMPAEPEWHHFYVSGDIAMVILDLLPTSQSHSVDPPGSRHEMRILVRDHGCWLHLAVVSLQPAEERARCPALRVDGKGQVLWKNDLAEARLARTDSLTIRAGRLRARSRAADRALQAGIAWAASMYGAPENRIGTGPSWASGSVLPIMATEADGSPAILCWIQLSNGDILVTIDDNSEAERRLRAAATVFGLSASQQRLVRLLFDGRELAEAAREMQVSVNTLRTQLRRIYEKTNVHNQAALFRLMFSVAPPL